MSGSNLTVRYVQQCQHREDSGSASSCITVSWRVKNTTLAGDRVQWQGMCVASTRAWGQSPVPLTHTESWFHLHFFETLNYLFMFYGLFTTGILGFFFSFLKKPICKSLIYIYNTLYPIFQIFPPSFLLPFKFPCSLLGEFSALFLCYFRLGGNILKEMTGKPPQCSC